MKRTIRTLLLFLACVALLAALVACGEAAETPSDTVAETEPATEPATEVGEHEHAWDEGQLVKDGSCDPETKEEIKGEVLYTCTICGETRTEEIEGHEWDDGRVIVAPTCKSTGSRLYTCAKCGKKEAKDVPVTDEHTFGSNFERIVTPPTETRDGVAERYCTVCGKAGSFPIGYTAYAEQVSALRTEVNSFKTAEFGGTNLTDTRDEMIAAANRSFSLPPINPTAGQHPRVLINESDLAGIRAELSNDRSATAVKQYYSYLQNPATGQLGAKISHGSDIDNFSANTLYNIQALALEYQLTGNEIVGYQAIRALKNYILTLDIEKITVDQERQYGFVMYIAACVYDWCHPLLTKTDKLQIVSGIEHKIVSGSNSYGVKMEMGFPPSKQNAIAGHGSEFQLLRDYLSFAIAIYDEYPGWWEYIGGRFYSEFVPVRNEYYKAGMYPQGVSLYVRVRFASDLYSAWLIKAMSGSIPYSDPAGMKQVMRTVFTYELPKKNAFASGDDHTSDDVFQDYGRLALISSYLFDDPAIRAELEYHLKSYTNFSETLTMSATVAEYLICSSNGVTASRRHEDMPLILYNGGWLGQIIARNNWGDDQAAVLMKIGERTTANHDHADAGQFQIWYKTMLAGDTGAYDTYGDTHFKQYHQATIAHNSLLIGGSGQKQPGETGNSNTWLGDGYKTGTVTGYAYGYADAEKTKPTYAYIAGDLTPAYDGKATEVARRMLVVYDTKNANIPLFFFVYDSITTSSATTSKTFLLHVPAEPTVSGNTVTVTKDGAKLVLQSVIGGDNISTIGGAGKNYYVNGQQIKPTNNGDDGFWGRVEISPNTGNKTNALLNVMFVCDSNRSISLPASPIETSVVKGAQIGGVAAVFVTSSTRRGTAFEFTVTRSGDVNYFVSGVIPGRWTVSVGGVTQTVTATRDGGFLSFTAPAGTVTLTPAK